MQALQQAHKQATLSPCGLYRYHLSREQSMLQLISDGNYGRLVFIMLNPSTADHRIDDRTISKCWGYAMRSGYMGFDVINLYAWRATDPDELKTAADPVGPENNVWIERVVERAMRLDRYAIVCAWGVRGGVRAMRVAKTLTDLGARLHYLRLTKDGHPEHPLYLPNACMPTLWDAAKEYAA